MTHDVAQLTPQQQAAIYTRGVSIALSAGAGCGKTFVLTQRYLAFLEPEPQAEKTSSTRGRKSADVQTTPQDRDLLHGVVAITFTERAAREMRDRIRAACHERLQQVDADDPGQLEHWLVILRSLDTARISTIHSFCAALLRSHAVEAGLDPQFAVMEQAIGEVLLRRAVSEALQQLLVDRNASAMHLVLHYGLERTQDLVRSLVAGRFHAGSTDFSNRNPEAHVADWLRRWQTESVPQLLREFVESPAVLRVLTLLQANEPSHPEMQSRCRMLLSDLPTLAESGNSLDLLTALQEAAKIQGGGGKTAWPSEEIYDGVRNAFENLRKSIKRLTDDLDVDESEAEAAARFSLAAQEVVQSATKLYESKKQEAGMLDFDDLLLRTRDLLRDNQAVCERASRGIDLLMIDEFQDTDPVQSEIVEHLCGSQLLHGKLFLVGDAKQSIYRFRRADPRVFADLRERIPESGRLPLSTNFRSQPEILNFVNAVFAETLNPGYEPLVPYVSQITPPPAVEFLFPSPDMTEDSPTRESADERRRREADWIARRLNGLLNSDERIVRRENPQTGKVELDAPRPGDIAVLFRTLSNVGLYEEALRRYGIEYYLVGGRAFFAQQEVFDLVNLCSCIDDPDDEVSLVGVLRSPFFSLSDDTLLAMSNTTDSFGEALETAPPEHFPEKQAEQWRSAARVISELRGKKDRVPLASLLRLAIERTGYDAAVLNEFLGRRKLANLNKLIEMAREFDRSGLCSMGEFVTRLRDSVAEQSDEELAATHPETSNVVRLMTIHQSKGLEFPMVVVADMDWTRRGGSTGARQHPELGPLLPMPSYRGLSRRNLGQRMYQLAEAREEERENYRVLYVATTRAADLLIFSAGLPPDRKLSSPWMQLLAKRFDIDTGLPIRDPYLGRLSLGEISPDQIPQIRVHHQIPEIGGRAESRTELVPLGRFREMVELAEAIPLPATLMPVRPHVAGKVVLSVSAIEEADPEKRPLDGLVTAEDATDEVDEETREQGRAEEFGEFVHEILEQITPRTTTSIDTLVESIAARSYPNLNEMLRRRALERARAFLESALFSELSGATTVHRELDFLLRWPPVAEGSASTVISGKIDCLYRLPDDRWALIDYKTGRLPLRQQGAVIEKYGVQMGIYALASRALIGRVPDVVEIIGVHDTVRRYPVDVTETFLAAITRRVGAAVRRLRGNESREQP